MNDDELKRRNTITERIGISKDVEINVKIALKNFRSNNSLPGGCDENHFRAWVSNNVPLYIGKSSTKHNVAAKELSEWYIYFNVFFPGQPMPPNPFAESLELKYRRLLALLELGLIEGSSRGTVPQMSTEHMAGFRTIFNKAVSDLEVETLIEKSYSSSSSGPSRKRRRKIDDTDNGSPSSGDLLAMPPTTQSSSNPRRGSQQPEAISNASTVNLHGMGPPPIPNDLNLAHVALLERQNLANPTLDRTDHWVQGPGPGPPHFQAPGSLDVNGFNGFNGYNVDDYMNMGYMQDF